MHTCIYILGVCACVRACRERESVCVQFLFPISSKHILHASVSTPSFCLPALQLFTSYFPLFLYQRGKKVKILMNLYSHLSEILERCDGFRNQWAEWISLVLIFFLPSGIPLYTACISSPSFKRRIWKVAFSLYNLFSGLTCNIITEPWIGIPGQLERNDSCLTKICLLRVNGKTLN